MLAAVGREENPQEWKNETRAEKKKTLVRRVDCMSREYSSSRPKYNLTVMPVQSGFFESDQLF